MKKTTSDNSTKGTRTEKKVRTEHTTRTSAKPRKSKKRKSQEGHWWNIFKKIPAWAMWIGGVLCAGAYIFVFYYFFVSPYSIRWKALYGEVNGPDGFEIRGIDISHYQEDIDWERVRNATIEGSPVSFVIIKATEGITIMDENFNDNFYQARENDIIRGAYHFYVPSVPARQQANYFLKQVHLEPGDLPPVLDVEKYDGSPLKKFQQDIKTWLDVVEKKYGVKPIIYTGYKFKMSYLNDSVFNEYPYWIAHYYVDTLTYTGPWKFWQHTDCGKVQGIKGYVDLNIYNGTMYDLRKLCIPQKEDDEEQYE